MRNLGFFAIAALLILVQSNLYRLIGPLGALIGPHLLHGVTPSLALPLVIFLGVHEPSMPRGAALSFAIGYAQDLLGAAPIGLFTFVYVMIWWLSRVAGVRLTAQTVLTRMSLAFIFALVQTAVILVLLAVFGSDNRRPLEVATIALPHAATTALVAPLLFRLAQRMRQGGIPARAAGEALT
jgi:rod shape-determining protein MreD